MCFFQRNWFPLLFISRSSSFPVIQVNVDIKILWKERLVFFFKSPGAHVIYRRIERGAWNAKISPQLQHTPPPTGWLLTPSPSPSVCTLSVRSYADVITNFSRMDRWPNFLKGLRSRAWSSAKIDLHCHFFFISEFQTVHGRILAVNMAYLRKKRQTAGNEKDGEHAYKEIVKINKGIQITSLNKFIYLLLK